MLPGEARLGLLDFQRDRPADEFQPGIAHQRAGQQPGFRQHLEAVADAEHRPPFSALRLMTSRIMRRMRAPSRRSADNRHRRSRRAARSDRPSGTSLSACHTIAGFLPVICSSAIAASRSQLERGKNDDGGFHRQTLHGRRRAGIQLTQSDARSSHIDRAMTSFSAFSSISYFSITVLASSFSHIALTLARALWLRPARQARSRSTCPGVPRRRAEAQPVQRMTDGFALGSRTPFFRVTNTRAFIAWHLH